METDSSSSDSDSDSNNQIIIKSSYKIVENSTRYFQQSICLTSPINDKIVKFARSFDGNHVLLIPEVKNKIILWNLFSDEKQAIPISCKGEITAIDVSPISQIFALGTSQGEIILFNFITYKQELIYEVSNHHSIIAVSFSPNSQTIAYCFEDNLFIQDLATKEVLENKICNQIKKIIFSQKTIVVVKEYTITIFDSNTYKQILNWEEQHQITTATLDEKNQVIIYSIPGNFIYIWDISDDNYDYTELSIDIEVKDIFISKQFKNKILLYGKEYNSRNFFIHLINADYGKIEQAILVRGDIDPLFGYDDSFIDLYQENNIAYFWNPNPSSDATLTELVGY